MGFFNNILQKLGLSKDKPASTSAAPATAGVTPKPKAAVARGDRDDLVAKNVVAKAVPVAISAVDVVKQLEQLSVGKNLNWKVSIVDLLTLLDIDSSREARNELATELGCPADMMSDSAKMNTWLHKTVLKKIAENGGNIPQSLLD